MRVGCGLIKFNFKITAILTLMSVSHAHGGEASVATSGIVAITSVNGVYDSRHPHTLNVQPGDVITLSADSLDETHGYQAMHSNVEEFAWVASDLITDSCNGSAIHDCFPASNFQMNNYGVAFYVPATMGAQITISVRDRNNVASYDAITLMNSRYQTIAYVAPTLVVTNPIDYDYPLLDPTLALHGQGNWVTIHGMRYWSPFTYMISEDEAWAPYRNGYWAQSDTLNSLVWISFDPWGWMTEHYGFWRYHQVYGWLWSPFNQANFSYHPYCATWFDDGSNYVGWYPYCEVNPSNYSDGVERGFVDGYGLGSDVASSFGESDDPFHAGFTILSLNHFTDQNVANSFQHTLVNQQFNSIVVNAVKKAFTLNSFGPVPRSVIEDRLGIIPVTTLITAGRNGSIEVAQGVYAVPLRYTEIASLLKGGQAFAIGSAVDARSVTIDSSSAGKPVMISPTQNGRGVVAAPTGHDSFGTLSNLPPQTLHPAEVNPANYELMARLGKRPILPNPSRPEPPALPYEPPHPMPTHPHPDPHPYPHPFPEPHLSAGES